jgi:hypothetical protein
LFAAHPKGGFKMAEGLNRVTEEMMEIGPRIFSQMGKQFESLQETISLNPSDDEVAEALGKEAPLAEQDAYRQGHQSGWYKGALMFGFAVLAGLAVLSFATSGESKKIVGQNSLRSLTGSS